MRRWIHGMSLVVLAGLAGCNNVDVTKTAKGYFAPTDPNNVEILTTKPDKPFTELATISTTQWSPGDSAKMHNALRAKSAPLGADAVILLSSGINQDNKLWSTGVAIKFKDSPPAK